MTKEDTIRFRFLLPASFATQFLAPLKTIGYTDIEIVKAGIRILYKKEFPTYVKVPKFAKTKDAAEGLTDEELCTDVFGGTVDEDNGIKVCSIKNGNFTDKIPLTALRGQLK